MTAAVTPVVAIEDRRERERSARRELIIRTARSDAEAPGDALARIAHAYLEFARDHPAVYDAMFTRKTTLRFADPDTPPQLSPAFAELRQSVALVADERDADALTEVLWAALHGLVTLGRAGRLRPGFDADRVRLLVEQFTR
jgi:Tetracyclin repressor-like, C-terminal domain